MAQETPSKNGKSILVWLLPLVMALAIVFGVGYNLGANSTAVTAAQIAYLNGQVTTLNAQITTMGNEISDLKVEIGKLQTLNQMLRDMP